VSDNDVENRNDVRLFLGKEVGFLDDHTAFHLLDKLAAAPIQYTHIGGCRS
jgi:hypothetical protein